MIYNKHALSATWMAHVHERMEVKDCFVRLEYLFKEERSTFLSQNWPNLLLGRESFTPSHPFAFIFLFAHFYRQDKGVTLFASSLFSPTFTFWVDALFHTNYTFSIRAMTDAKAEYKVAIDDGKPASSPPTTAQGPSIVAPSIFTLSPAMRAALPIASYCFASILMTVTNKYVVSGYGFNMNFLLLTVQVHYSNTSQIWSTYWYCRIWWQ